MFLLYRLLLALCSLAPPIISFSHGASHASCRDMIPGHIRAHPLDPHHSYVGVRTSASSYLPGQLITVTVRSSRDFMGFLLQARSVEVTKSLVAGRAGIKSKRLGLLLVGGSWILTPPGTHTLHCFSEGDTVTHSSKQRKRNLSFLWRAPDVPMGDVQFHITVVPSYFVYWAGIESAVVRDGTRRAWRGSNTTMLDGASTAFVFKEEKATSFQGLLSHRTTKKQGTRTASPASTSQRTKASSTTHIPKSLKTFTDVSQPTLKSATSVTLSNHATSQRKTLGSRQTDTDTTPASLSELAKETGFDSASQTNDPKTYFPFTTSVVPLSTTKQISISPLSPGNSLVPFFPLSEVETETKEPTTNYLEPKLNTELELKDTSSTFKTTETTLTIRGFHRTNTPTTTKQKGPANLETQTRPEELRVISTESLMSTVQAKIGTHTQTSTSRPTLQSLSDRSEGSHFSQSSLKHQASPTKIVLPLNSSTLKSFPTFFLTQANLWSNPRPSGPKSTTKQANWSESTTPLIITSDSQSLGSFHRSVTEQALTPSSVPPQLVNTSNLDDFEELRSHPAIKTASPVLGFVPTAASSTSLSTFPDIKSVPSPSTSSFQTSPVNHPSVVPPLHPSGALTMVSMHPSVKTKPKTAPALSAVPSPSPIATPLWLTSARLSSTSPLPYLFTSTATSISKTSKNPSQASFSLIPESTLPPFNSSQCITLSTSSSSSTTASDITSFSSSLTTSTVAPSFFSPTSTSTSFREGFTSHDIGPPSALYHSLHTHPTSSVPSQEITVGQTMLSETHITSTQPGQHSNPPTQRTVVHPNPKPHPNLRLDHGQDFKPKILSDDTKPSKPAETPNKEGKYPEIIPRHSSWELGMLLGCSAGLGMALVIGVRYVYRQACGRRTEVTLNDREREYERGDRGLIQVQECGDLVRVRKIRENSFVLLTEYDILASPGH